MRGFRKPEGVKPFRAEHARGFGWALLPADRSPERELGVGRLSALKSLLTGLELGSDGDELTRLVALLNSRLDETAAVLALRARLAGDLSALLPRVVTPGDLVVRVTSAINDDPREYADLHLRQGGQSKPLHKQSDGSRAMSTVVVQQLAKAASLLAIDEPEIHLHPRSRARMGHLLAAASGQRLVATHSPWVLSAFSPSDAVALLPTGARQLPKAAINREPAFYAHWWTDHSIEPLTSRVTILVEGPSDQLILRRVATLLDMDLDHHGCSVVVARRSRVQTSDQALWHYGVRPQGTWPCRPR